MTITMISIGCLDKSPEYRDGYLDLLLSRVPNSPLLGRDAYLNGYIDAALRRDKSRKAQLEFGFKPTTEYPHKCKALQTRCSCGRWVR